jgi:protein-arginine kinase activator protein McsA
MKCYHCRENDAEYRFIIHYMDQVGEIHLCETCLERFRRYTEKLFGDDRESEPARKDTGDDPRIRGFYRGFAPSGARPRALGEDDFPADAGDAMRRRRRLNELRESLKAAVAREDYETAATLRDEINRFSYSFTRDE